MGEVYLARVSGAAGFRKPVVIKKILPHLVEEPNIVAALINEAKLMVMMDHPNIVQVLDLGEEGGTYFMAMEFVQGYNLSSLIGHFARARRIIPAPICVHLTCEILSGLAYIHGLRGPDGEVMNILHRDVSPQNVLISREGRVKLTDFGIAKVLRQASGDFTGSLKGKLRYMAPETLDRERLDHRYDLFATAVVLFEALSRAHLYPGKPGRALMKQVRDAVIPPVGHYHPGLPRELGQAVTRGLARDPDLRYQTAGELRAALRASIPPHELEAAPAALQALVQEVYADPDFPHGREKLPDLGQVHGDETVELVITSTLEATDTEVGGPPPGFGPAMTPTPTTAETAPQARVNLVTVMLAVGLAVVAGLTAFLFYQVSVKEPAARTDDKPVIIVKPKRVAPAPTPRATPAPVAAAQEKPAEPAPAATPAPRPRVKRKRPAGPFSPQHGARAFRRSNAALSRCFTAHQSRAGAAGEIKLQVISTIAASGKVTAVRLEPAGQAATPLGKCVTAVARKVRYPAHDRPSVNFVQPLRVKRQGQ